MREEYNLYTQFNKMCASWIG